MPEPRTANLRTAQTATGTHPLGIPALWEVPRGKILGITGVPAAFRGSMVFEHAGAFGFIIVNGGWDVRGARKGKLNKYTKGLEDTTGRIS